jgi:hypothetical protein
MSKNLIKRFIKSKNGQNEEKRGKIKIYIIIFRTSRRSYQPSIGSRNGSRQENDPLRHLSSTRRELDEEHKRLKSALDSHSYGRNVFD